MAAGSVTRLFVLVWSPRDIVRAWLDGLGAIDLHTRDAAPAPDAFMFDAAKMIVRQEYNGLSSGHGKDTVVQLVRSFADNGYPVDVDAWVPAYFAAGGSFSHAESLKKLVKETQSGTRHRVKRRYRDDIFDINPPDKSLPANSKSNDSAVHYDEPKNSTTTLPPPSNPSADQHSIKLLRQDSIKLLRQELVDDDQPDLS